MRTLENSAQVNYLLGKLDIISEDDLNSKLQKLNINEENIEKFMEEQINKVYREQNQTSEFITVNQMFCYGRTGNTLHMHLIPKDLRKTKESLGDEKFYKYYKDQLEDFLCRLQEIFRKDSTIQNLFAVSPIFFNSDIAEVHTDLGFDSITEITFENTEDKMSIEQKENFLKMFNKDDEHKRKVYYTNLSREDLLRREYKTISNEEKLNFIDIE